MNQKKSGIILSWTTQGILVLSGLIYTPISLRILGQSEYGLYQLTGSVVSYLGLLGFGFSSSYIRFYSRYKTVNYDDDREKLARLNGMFFTIFLCIAAICLLFGMILVANLSTFFGSEFTISEYARMRALLIMMVIGMALTFIDSTFSCQIAAHEKFFYLKLLDLIQVILNPFISAILLFLGFQSIGLAVVTAAITAVKLSADIWYSFKHLKIKFIFRGFDFKLLKEMFRFTFFIFLDIVVEQINWNTDKYLLGLFSGTKTVAVYGVSLQVITLFRQINGAIRGVFIPQINEMVIGMDSEGNGLTKFFTRIGRINYLIVFLMFSGFVFFGKNFIALWAGTAYEESYIIILILMVALIIPSLQGVGIDIQRAMNKHKARSLGYLLMAILNIIISIPLIQWRGGAGAAMGTALCMFLGNGLFMNWYYHHHIGLNIIYFGKEICRLIPASIICLLTGWFLTTYILNSTIGNLILCIIIYILTYAIVMWFAGLQKNEKELAKTLTENFRK